MLFSYSWYIWSGILICLLPNFCAANINSDFYISFPELISDTTTVANPNNFKETLRKPLFHGKSLPVDFGIKLGTSYSNMNFNKGYPKPLVKEKSSWNLGLLAGMLVEIHLSEKFSLQQEYLYSSFVGKDKSLGKKIHHKYFAFPMLIKYKPNKFRFSAGMQFGLLLTAEEQHANYSAITTHDTEERKFGVLVETERLLSKHIILNVRIVHGINHIGVGQRTTTAITTTKKEFKYEIVQLTGIYLL